MVKDKTINILMFVGLVAVVLLVINSDTTFLGAVLTQQPIPSEIGSDVDIIRQDFLNFKYGLQCYDPINQINKDPSNFPSTVFETNQNVHFLDTTYTSDSSSFGCVNKLPDKTLSGSSRFAMHECQTLFDFTVEKKEFFENTVNKLEINIQNNYGRATNLLIDAFLIHILDDGSKQTIDLTQEVLVLEEGLNLPKELILPSDLKAGRYDLFISISSLAGNQLGSCGGHTAHLDLTDVKHFNFGISTKPISYPITNGECPNGYEIIGEACVDVNAENYDCNLPDMSCPVTVDFEYECTSSGICTEPVYRAQRCTTDEECGLNLLCEETTGVCFNEVLEPIFIECDSTSTAPNVCEGVTANCVLGKWQYTGSCEPIIEDCNTKGCPFDYECIELTGNCKYNPEQEPETIQTTEEVTKKSNTLFIVIGLTIVALIIFLLVRKK